MNQGKTVFAQLMSLLPEYELKKCINRYNGDFHSIKFTCRDQFMVMSFTQLTDRSGLRDIEATLIAFSSKLNHAGLKFVPKSTLAEINEKKDWRIYQDFAQVLIAEAQRLYHEDYFRLGLENMVYAFDSSTIDKGADFVIEFKANQRSLRYGLEDSIKTATPTDVYKEGPYLEHGRIESRICRIYHGEELIVDREKWNGNLTVVEILTSTEKKSDARSTSEQQTYISSLDSSAERLSQITKQHWAIESMHWNLDRNLRQDSIKRKAERTARNLDTIQRMVLALIAVWKNKRKKVSDKRKGTAEIMRELSVSFTNVLHFLAQK